MSKVKIRLIKFFALIFAISVSFSIITIKNQDVLGATSAPAIFQVVGTSIRNEEIDELNGLRFTTKVTDTWLDENKANFYTFGTIITPTDNLSAFDSSKTPIENIDLLDGEIIIAVENRFLTESFEFTASIIYDRQVVVNHLNKKGSAVSPDKILENLYKKSFTAIPFAMIDGDVIYADYYSETMYNTALKALDSAIENQDEELARLARKYL